MRRSAGRAWMFASFAGAGLLWWRGGGPDALGHAGRDLISLFQLGPAFARNAARAGIELLLAVAALAWLAGTGASALSFLGCRRRTTPTGAGMLLAYTLVSFTFLGLAAVGLWWPRVLAATALLPWLMNPRSVPGSIGRGWSVLRDLASRSFAGIVLGALGLWLLVYLIPAECCGDSLQYHLACPQQWLRAHRLIGDQVFWYMHLPLPVEMPYALAVTANVHFTLRLVILGMVIMGCASFVHGLGGRMTAAMAGLGIAAAVYSHGAGWTMVTLKNDVAVPAFALMGFGLLLRNPNRTMAPLILAAWFIGFAVTAKYVVGPLILAFSVGCWLAAAKGGFRRGWRLLPIAILPAVPWMVKAWILCADPLPPAGLRFLPSWFGFPGRQAAMLGEMRAFEMPRDHWRAPLDTIRVAIPRMWLLIPALPWLAGHKAARRIAIAGIAGLLLQTILQPGGLFEVERFGMLAAIVWGLIGWSLLCGTPGPDRPLAIPAAVLIAGIGCVNGLAGISRWTHLTFDGAADPVGYVSGRLTRQEYTLRAYGSYGRILPALNTAVGNTAHGTIIEYGDATCPDAPNRVRLDFLGPAPIWKSVSESSSLDRMHAKFRQMDARWLLFNSERPVWSQAVCSPYEWTPRMLSLWSEFCGRRLRTLATAGRWDPMFGCFWLYDIAGSDEGIRPNGFLPGIDRALCATRIPRGMRNFDASLRAAEDLRRSAKDAAVFDGIIGGTLFEAGRTKESLPYFLRAIHAGVIHDLNLLQALAAAIRLRRDQEVAELGPMAWSWYPSRRDTIRDLLRRGGYPPISVR